MAALSTTALGLSYIGVSQMFIQEVYNGVVSIMAADKLKPLSLQGAFTTGNIVQKMQAANEATCAREVPICLEQKPYRF
jgi:hypothetical protein